MPIPVISFQPETFEQANPLLTGIQAGQNIFSRGLTQQQQALQNALAKVQLQYAPQAQESNIAYKNALSTYQPYNYISRILADPFLTASLSNEQRNTLLKTMASIPFGNNIGGNSGGMGMPAPQGNMFLQQGSSAPQQMEEYLRQNPQAAAELQRNGQYTIPSPGQFGGASQQSMQSPAQAPTQYTPQNDGIDLTDPRMNAYNRDFGNPQANAAAAQKFPSLLQQQLKAQNIQEAKTGTSIRLHELNNLEKESNKAGDEATELLRNTEKFKKAYDNTWIKGQAANLLGEKIASFSSEGTEAMQAATNTAVNIASKLFGNKQSDYREALAQKLKFSISMPKEAVQHIVNSMRAEALRYQEYGNFVEEAEKQGIKQPNKIRNLWYNYNIDKPFYDTDKREIITKNLNTYKDYLEEKILGKKPSAQPATPQGNNDIDYSIFSNEELSKMTGGRK